MNEYSVQPALVEPIRKSVFPIVLFVLLVFFTSLSGLLFYQNWQLRQQLNAPTTYAECLKAPGSVLQESYPATCVTRNGKRFKQPLTDEEKKKLELPADPTSSWKTYVDGSFSFKYPPTITITDTVQGLGTIFKIVGLDKEISLAVEPRTDHNFYADKKISNTFTFNKVDWNYLTGDTQFCDGGECGRISDALQTTEHGKRYTVVLGNLPYPNTIVDQILSTFKFIN